MPFDLADELDPGLQVLQLRAQWVVDSPTGGAFVGAGESSWSFIVNFGDFVSQATGLAEHWLEFVKPFWMARRPVWFILQRVLVEDRYPHLENDIVVDVNETGDPDREDSAPVQVGPIVTWYSTLQGRSYRGRTFWGPIARDDLQGQDVSIALSNDVETWAEVMMDEYSALHHGPADAKFAIISLRHNNAPEPIGRYVFVDHFVHHQYLATMRRRQRYYRGAIF